MADEGERTVTFNPWGLSLLFTVIVAMTLFGTLFGSPAGALVLGVLIGLAIAYGTGWRPRVFTR